jgi:hypothetical protein
VSQPRSVYLRQLGHKWSQRRHHSPNGLLWVTRRSHSLSGVVCGDEVSGAPHRVTALGLTGEGAFCSLNPCGLAPSSLPTISVINQVG